MFLKAASVAVLFSCVGFSAHATCVTYPFIFELNGDSINATSVSDDGKCSFGYRNGRSSAYDSADIVKSPTHGSLVNKSKYNFNYTAVPNYKGSDAMAIKICGDKLGKKGCSTLNYAITVK